MTNDRLREIRDWYLRHRNDYDPRSPNTPPKVWSAYFSELLMSVETSPPRREADTQEREP